MGLPSVDNATALRLQRIVVQNDLSVNSKLFGFAGNSCHQALTGEYFSSFAQSQPVKSKGKRVACRVAAAT
jgi:hypothetical protein